MENKNYQDIINSVEEGMKILSSIPEAGEELVKSEDESVEEVIAEEVSVEEATEEVAKSEDTETETVEEVVDTTEEVAKSEDTETVEEVETEEEVSKSEEAETVEEEEAEPDDAEVEKVEEVGATITPVLETDNLKVLSTMATAITDLTALFTNMKDDITALKDSQEVISKSLEEAKVEREELSKSLVEPEAKSAVMPVQREVLSKSEEVLEDGDKEDVVEEAPAVDTFGADVEDFFFGKGHALSPRDVEALRPIVISSHRGDVTEEQRKAAELIMDKYNK